MSALISLWLFHLYYSRFYRRKFRHRCPEPSCFLRLFSWNLSGSVYRNGHTCFAFGTGCGRMIISTQSSLANAQIFNPAFAGQGSVIGGFITLAGTLLIFRTDMHQLIILAMIRSYELFPLGRVPDTGSMAALLVKEVSWAFVIGIQMTAPFLVVVMLLYIGMGIMSKLMPKFRSL